MPFEFQFKTSGYNENQKKRTFNPLTAEIRRKREAQAMLEQEEKAQAIVKQEERAQAMRTQESEEPSRKRAKVDTDEDLSLIHI